MTAAARSAPEWRLGQPLEQRHGFTVSPSLSALAGHELVTVGDELVCHYSEPRLRLQREQVYKVVRLYEPDHRGIRRLELTGGVILIMAPDLWNYVKRLTSATPAARPSVSLGGVPLRTGLWLIVVDDSDLPLESGTKYLVLDYRVDPDGDVAVLLNNQPGWFYVTSGGALLPSLRLLAPSLNAGVFRYDDYTLSVGMAVKVFGCVAKVLGIREDAEVPGRFWVSYSGHPGEAVLFENDLSLDRPLPCLYEISQQRVVFDTQTLDLVGFDHLLAITPCDPLTPGQIYRLVGLVPKESDGSHPFDLDLCLENVADPLPVIRQSQWVLPAGCLPAAVRFECGEWVSQQGQEIILRDKIRPAHWPCQASVHCFLRNVYDKTCHDVVLTDGWRVSLVRSNFGGTGLPVGHRFASRLRLARTISASLRDAAGKMYNIPLELQQEYMAVNWPNQVLGKDYHGLSVLPGDVVLIRASTFAPDSYAVPRECVGALALVVHAGRYSDNRTFGYLYFGKKINARVGTGTNVYSSLPARYTAGAENGLIALNDLIHCEVLLPA